MPRSAWRWAPGPGPAGHAGWKWQGGQAPLRPRRRADREAGHPPSGARAQRPPRSGPCPERRRGLRRAPLLPTAWSPRRRLSPREGAQRVGGQRRGLRWGRRRGRRRGPRPGVALGLRWAGGGRDWARRLRAEEVHGPPLRFSGRIRHAHPHSDLGLLPPELGDDTFLLFRAGRLCSLSEQPQETKPGAEVQGPRAGPHPSHDPPPHARVPVGHSGRWGAGGYRTFPRDMGGPLAKCHSSASSRLP